MPNTYTQVYIHLVFATEYRSRLLRKEMRTELFDYTAGIVRELNCFVQCIGGMEDHVHLLIGLIPSLSISTFAQKVKANTSRFINDKAWIPGKFRWQDGYGAFSVSQSALEQVRGYIRNQEQHHSSRTFSEEYLALLEKHNISYDEKYIFRGPSDMA